MTYAHWLIVLSAGITIAGASAYIRDTLMGKTQPNRVSWFLWGLTPLIGTGAALSAHADPWVVVRIFLAGFLPLLVVGASFVNKSSYWKLSFFDILCGACSLVAIFLWLFLGSPIYAILFAAVADGFASLPTIRKAWKYPETETGITYGASLVSTLLVIPSIAIWNIENSAFQVYLIAVNVVLVCLVYRRIFFRSDVSQ